MNELERRIERLERGARVGGRVLIFQERLDVPGVFDGQAGEGLTEGQINAMAGVHDQVVLICWQTDPDPEDGQIRLIWGDDGIP